MPDGIDGRDGDLDATGAHGKPLRARRELPMVVAAVCAIVALVVLSAWLLLARPAATDDGVTWAAREAPDLSQLTTPDSTRVFPVTCFKVLDDGSVQLQYATGSHPHPAIRSAVQHGTALTVTMEPYDGPMTMDLGNYEFLLTPQGEASANVESLTLIDSGGNGIELEAV